MTPAGVAPLALLGGMPAFVAPLHVGRPDCGDRAAFLARVHDILDSSWLTNDGPYVRRFEAFVAQTTGTAHCVAFSSATTALELLVEALGLQGEVIVPAFTFPATPHALLRNRIAPVFCDIDPRTCCVDPHQVELLITPRTSGVLAVHCWGNACHVDALTRICRARALPLLFDAAHAFMCAHRGRSIGGFGDAEVFSFHATKFLNSFEGGAVTTNDGALARALRLLRNFGLSDGEDAVAGGTNGKMPEIAAAMGLTMAEAADRILAANQRNVGLYAKALAGIDGVTLMPTPEDGQSNAQYVVALVDVAVTGLSRDLLLAVLVAENVLARRYFYPGCHRLSIYREHYRRRPTDLRQTEGIVDKVLVLPTGPEVGAAQIDRIGAIIRTALVYRDEVRAATGGR